MTNLWSFMFPILAFVCAGMIYNYKIEKLKSLERSKPDPQPEQLARLERLEQRMATIERIVTDRSNALGNEIDRLRHAPVN